MHKINKNSISSGPDLHHWEELAGGQEKLQQMKGKQVMDMLIYQYVLVLEVNFQDLCVALNIFTLSRWNNAADCILSDRAV